MLRGIIIRFLQTLVRPVRSAKCANAPCFQMLIQRLNNGTYRNCRVITVQAVQIDVVRTHPLKTGHQIVANRFRIDTRTIFIMMRSLSE
ncbi:hypothetical protein D3C85_1544160 [compost metagenome]